LAEAVETPLVCDCYDNAADTDPTRLLPILTAAKTAGEALQEFSDLANCTAGFSNGWVTLRTKCWELERAKTISSDVLAAFLSAREQAGGVTIEAQIKLIAALSDLQARSDLLTLVMDSLGLGRISDSSLIHFLKGLATLGPIQWEMLKTGRGIAYGDLPLEARREFSESIFRARGLGVSATADYPFEDVNFETEPGVPEDQAQDAMADTDMMDSKNDADETFYDDSLAGPIEDDEITQLLPDGPPPETVLSLDIQKRQGASVRLSIGGRPASVAGSVSMIAGLTTIFDSQEGVSDIFGPVDLKVDGFRAANVENWRFLLVLGTKTLDGGSLVSTTASGPFGPIEALPAELTQRLRRAQAEFKKMFQSEGGGSDEPPPPPGTFHQR
jgi:hypothetical protein